MSSFNQTVVNLPSDWSTVIRFKPVKSGDKLGFIDTFPNMRTSFKFLGASDKPLKVYPPRMPFDCITLQDILAKNKLSIRFQMNETIWNSLKDLDEQFDSFLIANRTKLFGPAEAEYIEKNPSAIALKRSKRLAPLDQDGHPIFDAYATLRVNGRTSEVEAVTVKEGSSGRYISDVTWAPRTGALPPGATRFSIVTGVTELNGVELPIVRDSLRVAAAAPGDARMRYVGPGDMSKNCVLRHLELCPKYWSCMGGGAAVTLVVSHLIFENIAEDSEASTVSTSMTKHIPDGFARDPHDSIEAGEALPPPPAPAPTPVAAFSSSSSTLAAVPEKKRRIMAETVTEHHPAPTRSMTGGAVLTRRRAVTAAGADEFDEERIWDELKK